MAVKRIRIYGDPFLKVSSAPVADFNQHLALLVQDMADTMYENRGIGLAALQVGVSQRVFVVDTDWVDEEGGSPSGARHLKVFVNPEILWESQDDSAMSEGCLSLPEIEGEVYRPTSVRLRWQDQSGTAHERLMEGLEARCAQHELDHLNGILFVDRMPFTKRRLLAGRLRQLKEKHTPARPQHHGGSENPPL